MSQMNTDWVEEVLTYRRHLTGILAFPISAPYQQTQEGQEKEWTGLQDEQDGSGRRRKSGSRNFGRPLSNFLILSILLSRQNSGLYSSQDGRCGPMLVLIYVYLCHLW